MNFKKLFMGGIVGGILYFGLGYLIYGKLLMGFMHDHPGLAINVDRAEADIQFLYLIIGNLLGGFLLAYIFIKANVGSIASGFVTGGIVGFLSTATHGFISYGVTNIMSRTALGADIAAATVMSAIVGAFVALVMGLGKKTA